MCAARVRSECPECLVRQDAACTSRRTLFFLMVLLRESLVLSSIIPLVDGFHDCIRTVLLLRVLVRLLDGLLVR